MKTPRQAALFTAGYVATTGALLLASARFPETLTRIGSLVAVVLLVCGVTLIAALAGTHIGRRSR